MVVTLLILCDKPSVDKSLNTGVKDNSLYTKVKDSDTVTFYWNASHNYFDTVQYYMVSFHTEADTTWKVIKTNIPQADSPHVVIRRSELPGNDSIFFFGVQSITQEGIHSDMHSCTDSTASPPKWVLFWKNKI